MNAINSRKLNKTLLNTQPLPELERWKKTQLKYGISRPKLVGFLIITILIKTLNFGPYLS